MQSKSSQYGLSGNIHDIVIEQGGHILTRINIYFVRRSNRGAVEYVIIILQVFVTIILSNLERIKTAFYNITVAVGDSVR